MVFSFSHSKQPSTTTNYVTKRLATNEKLVVSYNETFKLCVVLFKKASMNC